MRQPNLRLADTPHSEGPSLKQAILGYVVVPALSSDRAHSDDSRLRRLADSLPRMIWLSRYAISSIRVPVGCPRDLYAVRAGGGSGSSSAAGNMARAQSFEPRASYRHHPCDGWKSYGTNRRLSWHRDMEACRRRNPHCMGRRLERSPAADFPRSRRVAHMEKGHAHRRPAR